MTSPSGSRISTSTLIATFIFRLYTSHKPRCPSNPFVLALSGPQGIGKTTVTAFLQSALSGPPCSANIIVFSLDDIYYPSTTLSSLRTKYPSNKLLSVRGNPGTHDIPLGLRVLEDLKNQRGTKIPAYDKSLHSGRGDRVSELEWPAIHPPYDIVILEGWCVGFKSVESSHIIRAYSESSNSTLQNYKLEDVLWINKKLKKYESIWHYFDAFIHLDAQSFSFIPNWRVQQEHTLISLRGSGMSDEQVRSFVGAFMPAYEIYVPSMRRTGFLKDTSGEEENQSVAPVPTLRIRIGQNREVLGAEIRNLGSRVITLATGMEEGSVTEMEQSLAAALQEQSL